MAIEEYGYSRIWKKRGKVINMATNEYNTVIEEFSY
jgi:hypothetical protein